MRWAPLAACVVGWCGLGSATPLSRAAETAASQNPQEVVRSALDSAATLLSDRQPREALAVLAPVETLEPDNPWLLFYEGVGQLQLGNTYEAIARLDRASTRLRELGDPEPKLAELIGQYRREARRQVFRLSYRTGLAYDTNVTFLGDQTSSLDLIAGRADGRFASTLELDHALIATEQQALVIGARLGHAWHFAVEEFDYQDYGGYIRYARQLDADWQAEVQYDYDMMFLGNEPFLSAHAVTPALVYHWQPGAARFGLDQTRAYYEFAGRDFLYDTTPEFDRDGCAHTVGVEQGLVFRHMDEMASPCRLAIGYGFSFIGTEGTEFERYAHDFRLGLEVPLVNPWQPEHYLLLPDKELVFHFDADWLIEDYRNSSLIDGDRDSRSDLTTTLGVVLSQKLIEDDQLGDLTLHAIITWTDANSNVTTAREQQFPYARSSPFTYDKVVYGIQLEWAW